MGPTLWSSDPAIFGVKPLPSQNGTHLDMLHDSPFCVGIAHERDNVYWLFNGLLGALDRYDFREPHEIGGEDHADGELRRFVEGQLLRAPETPSHLVIDKSSGLLYAVDGGHARILRLDTTSGIENGEVPTNDPLLVHARMQDADSRGDRAARHAGASERDRARRTDVVRHRQRDQQGLRFRPGRRALALGSTAGCRRGRCPAWPSAATIACI